MGWKDMPGLMQDIHTMTDNASYGAPWVKGDAFSRSAWEQDKNAQAASDQLAEALDSIEKK